jgi:branched-subunit amino acid aminotransferase/4-amino-4-deoxychorismate lyase
VRFGERVAERLVRDAARLGLGALERAAVLAALGELGAAAFGGGEGVVRIQASRGADGALRLVGTPRPLGAEPAAWSAVLSSVVHEGPGPFAGAKLSGHPRLAFARAEATAAGCEEALLLDAEGRLVEGARTALAVVLEDGGVALPPLARGGVRSVARDVVCAALPDLVERDVTRGALARARELVALNAVRGAVPVVRLGGTPVGSGAPGPLAARLRDVLARPEG